MAVVFLHGKMTKDALNKRMPSELREVAKAVQEVDFVYSHPKWSNHRPGKYQKEFEAYGGRECNFPGAEEATVLFLTEARELHSTNGKGAAKALGYAIHFIQDATLCPEHIFPFRELPTLNLRGPHTSFSVYLTLKYFLSRKWQRIVQNAKVTQIESLEDLRWKILETADWIRQLPCSYLRQDGEKIEDKRVGKAGYFNWRMRDSDLETILEKSAGLVKGTVVWLESR